MRTEPSTLWRIAGVGLVLLATGAVAAENESAAKDGEPKTKGLAGLFEGAGKLQMPSLAGLIKPEKMGLLADNQCQVQVKDNAPKLLSDNQPEMNLLSGNEASFLSRIHILSDLSVNVHITIHRGDAQAADHKAQAGHPKHKSRKAAKPKTARKPKER